MRNRSNPADPPVPPNTAQLAFSAVEAVALQSLSGWQKTFRLPERLTHSSEAFLASLSANELKHDLDLVYHALRTAFAFKRRQLVAAEPADGTGSILTPYFHYSVKVALNPNDLSEALWRRRVAEITEPRWIASSAFEAVFDRTFNALELAFPRPLDLAELVDGIEAAEQAQVQLSYDRELTFCELVLPGVEAGIRILPETLAIVYHKPIAPRHLLSALQQVRSLLLPHQAAALAHLP